MKNTSKILKNAMQIEQLEDRLEMTVTVDSSGNVTVDFSDLEDGSF